MKNAITPIYLETIDINNKNEVEVFSLISEWERNSNSFDLSIISPIIAKMSSLLDKLENQGSCHLWQVLYHRFNSAIERKVSIGG